VLPYVVKKVLIIRRHAIAITLSQRSEQPCNAGIECAGFGPSWYLACQANCVTDVLVVARGQDLPTIGQSESGPAFASESGRSISRKSPASLVQHLAHPFVSRKHPTGFEHFGLRFIQGFNGIGRRNDVPNCRGIGKENSQPLPILAPTRTDRPICAIPDHCNLIERMLRLLLGSRAIDCPPFFPGDSPQGVCRTLCTMSSCTFVWGNTGSRTFGNLLRPFTQAMQQFCTPC
jgi:hypothetical protein